MKRFTLLLLILFAFCSTAQATKYYMRPLGNDANDGLTGNIGRAWATLQHANATMVAGDTLFVMGGTYSTDQNWINGPIGTHLRPIVIRAYGDSRVVFAAGHDLGGGEVHIFRFYNSYYGGWITLDGTSALHPSDTTKYFKFSAPCKRYYAIESGNSGHWNGMVVRGCEFDGVPVNPIGSVLVAFAEADSFVLDNCYAHHAWHSTGDKPGAGGDGSDHYQETGSCFTIRSCEYGKITNCRFMYGNHDLGLIQPDWQIGGHTSKYITVSGCTFDNGWGGGLYLTMNSTYCLVENNIFLRAGLTTTYMKPQLQLSGSYNTIRKNVFTNPYNQGLRIEAQPDQGILAVANRNYVYNNTIFKSLGANLGTYVLDVSGNPCSVERNKIENNLLYKVSNYTWIEGSGNYWTNLWLNVNNALHPHEWLASADSTYDSRGWPNAQSPSTTHWGGNKICNNLLRLDSRGVADDSMVVYGAARPNGSFPRRVTKFQSAMTLYPNFGDPTVWANNIGGDPKLHSEDPAAHPTDWWYLETGSAAIDSGMAVVDSNGIWMRANAAGYAWDDLTYSGTAPDIGAYESSGGDPPVCSIVPTTLSFGTYTINDTSAPQSFTITNTGGGTLSGTVSEASAHYSLTDGGAYSLTTGQTKTVYVTFAPTAGGALPCTIETGDAACADVSCTGGACTMTPATLAFGNVDVGSCSAVDTLTITNTGTGTIAGTISESNVDFEITAGGGAYSLTAGQSRAIYVRFCPLTAGNKTCVIDF